MIPLMPIYRVTVQCFTPAGSSKEIIADEVFYNEAFLAMLHYAPPINVRVARPSMDEWLISWLQELIPPEDLTRSLVYQDSPVLSYDFIITEYGTSWIDAHGPQTLVRTPQTHYFMP